MAFGMNEALKITILGFAVVTAFSLTEELLQNRKMKAVNWLSKYSYELFLVHHLVIYAMTPYQPGPEFQIKEILWLFTKELIVIFAIAIVVKFISDKIIQCVLPEKKTC